MKIGVFDSGLGGLVITKAFISELKEYDYLYYGDSAHLPYGDKTSGQILKYTLQSLRYMIAQDCKLIIMACNTATAVTLRYVQQRFIPAFAPQVKVLGVVIPTVEVAAQDGAKKIGVVATSATIRSHIYQTELLKINPALQIKEIAAPELVPLIEKNKFSYAAEFVKEYCRTFADCDSLILGCTHYPLLKTYFRSFLPDVKIVSQDELMSQKLRDYLFRHPEIEKFLGKNYQRIFKVSSLNLHSRKVASRLFPEIVLLKA
ncbi:MAG: glutamate racemase [Alphaproteobacteria bacterium]|nr:glutamate racemase [Alphaproteobacteria bacterium]